MSRFAAVALVSCLALSVGLAAGCKKTTYKDSPETLERLALLEGQVKDKDIYIQKLRDENATLQRDGLPTGDNEWLFTIDGDALVIAAKPSGGGGGGGGIDDATATAMGEEFLSQVTKARGPIQKCYEQALKKSTGLQARTVNLKLSASFAASGSFSRVSFSPDLPEGFDSCLRTVASKWKMPAAKQSMTFQANVKLTPT
jgi:hypothetical protein